MTRRRYSNSSKVARQHTSAIERIRRLRAREERERTGLYYGAGIRFLAQAVKYNAKIEMVVVCPSMLINRFAARLVSRLVESGVQVIEVTPEVLNSMTLVADPQGVGAVVRQRWQPLERVKLGGKLCWIAHDMVQSPGNLGSIIRTSEAVGGAGTILLGDAIDPYDPATVRASMGALLAHRFVRTTPAELARWKVPRQWLLVGTSPAATVDYRSFSYSAAPTILLLGSERKGLSDDLKAICDVVVSIPMVGGSDSLNISVAAGILLYEVFNQRRGGGGYEP